MIAGLAAILTTFLFLLLYAVARRIVVDEIRYHAMGVAVATAAGIDPADLQQVQGPEDRTKAVFQDIQKKISAISRYSPDIRYVYIMRRAQDPSAKPSDYAYIVDQAPDDANHNGTIDSDEGEEDPGTPYDASDLPEMVRAWTAPSADYQLSPDPPYPDLISGYAPIRDAAGQTVAIVGADVTAGTLRAKLLGLRVMSVLVWASLLAIVMTTLLLYFAQADLARERERLVAELRDALDNVRTLSGLLPICASCKRIRDDVGKWEKLETYVNKRSGAEFSHTICPECATRLYPEPSR